MLKKSSTIILLSVLLITISSRLQPVNFDEILQHPEIQRIINENPELEIKLTELLQKLPPDLDAEYFANRIASILETTCDYSEMEYRLDALLRDLENFSVPSVTATWQDISIKKVNNMPLTPHEKIMITTVLEDFQVNENTSSCDQWRPAVAVDNEGNFVVVWEDAQNGKWDDERGDRYGGFPIWQFDIYARCFDKDGRPLGDSFHVTDRGLTPAVTVDQKGIIIITWEWNVKRFYYDVYAQRFNINGIPLGDPFPVLDNSARGKGQNPAIDADNLGNFLISWRDGRNDAGDIYAQRYDSLGTRIRNNFKVNDDTTTTGQSCPQIVFDSRSHFIITWMDSRNSNLDIYAQRYDSSGNPIGVNFRVNDDIGTAWQEYPDVAADGNGRFVITWRDGRNSGIGDIYAQCYKANGGPDGPNFMVNDDAGNNRQSLPDIAMDKDGRFLIIWYDSRNGNYDIYAQYYDSSCSALEVNFKVNDNSNSANQAYPAIDASFYGTFVLVWQDLRNGNYDIYAQRYNFSMLPLEQNFRVNADTISSYQIDAAIAVDGYGNFAVVWRDYRNDMGGDIYAQRFDSLGNTLDTNFRVNDDIGWNTQRYPDIAMFKDGSFVIAWHDSRNGETNMDIYAQRYNVNGQKIGSNLKANDDGDTKNQLHPAIAADDDSFFVVTWQDYRHINYDIFAQRFSYDGQKLGDNFRVNDDTENKWQQYPDVAMKDDGSFAITWEDYRNNNEGDIYAQCFVSKGNSIGGNFIVNDDSGVISHWYPKIAVTNNGKFMITWQDNRNGWHIYAQFYDSNRTPIRANFRVDDDFNSGTYPDISSCQNGNFGITFLGRRWDKIYDIYLQCYNKNGFQINKNIPITCDGEPPLQSYPSIASFSKNILLAWEDNRVPGQGWDIFAKIVEWDSTYEVFHVSGRINYYSDSLRMVPDAVVSLSGYLIEEDSTNIDGCYHFSNLYGGNYSTRPGKEHDIDNAITAYDASLILQYAVGLKKLNPYQKIAADVSGNGSVTPFDASLILRYVVGLIDSFPAMPDASHFWRLVPTNFPIDSTNWSTAPDSLSYEPLVSDTLNQNFVGIIYGDVSGNWNPNVQQIVAKKTMSKEVNVSLGEISCLKDNIYSTAIELDNESDLISASFGIKYDPAMIKILDVTLSELTSVFSLAYKVNESQVKVALSGINPLKEGGDIAYLRYELLQNLAESRCPLLISWAMLNEGNIITNIRQNDIRSSGLIPSVFGLSQNYPNPFNAETTIKYQLPQNCHITLKIFNILGQELSTLVDQKQQEGYYTVQLNANDLASGIYFYRLEAKTQSYKKSDKVFSQIKKLLILK